MAGVFGWRLRSRRSDEELIVGNARLFVRKTDFLKRCFATQVPRVFTGLRV